jgi:hypothetical protein
MACLPQLPVPPVSPSHEVHQSQTSNVHRSGAFCWAWGKCSPPVIWVRMASRGAWRDPWGRLPRLMSPTDCQEQPGLEQGLWNRSHGCSTSHGCSGLCSWSFLRVSVKYSIQLSCHDDIPHHPECCLIDSSPLKAPGLKEGSDSCLSNHHWVCHDSFNHLTGENTEGRWR